MESSNTTEVKDLGSLLLDVGIMLLSSGASCSRIRLTITRIASAFNYHCYTTIGPKSVSLTLNKEDDNSLFNGMRSINQQGVNLKLISGISRLSWDVVIKNLSIQQIKTELNRLSALPHYPRLIILFLVSLSGASFCYLFGGNAIEMLITFGATFIGLFVRQEAVKKNFNQYFCVYFGALAASLFAGAFIKAGLPIDLEHAFATCVLFLIPGVPLINSFTDLIDGNIQNGMVRGINGLMIAFSIALGLVTAMHIYNFK